MQTAQNFTPCHLSDDQLTKRAGHSLLDLGTLNKKNPGRIKVSFCTKCGMLVADDANKPDTHISDFISKHGSTGLNQEMISMYNI